MFKFVIRVKCKETHSLRFIHHCLYLYVYVYMVDIEFNQNPHVECLILTHHSDTIIQFEKSHLICRRRGYSVPTML